MRRPKIGLALGSGGARGYAHIGVLKVLKDHQIPIDYIAGSSMGSVVGVLFSSDIDIELLSKLAIHMKRKHLLDYTVPKTGFIRGEKIKELVRLLTKGKRLEELSIPTYVVATDLYSGERVIFTEGPIDEAIRASISIPGIFEPMPWGDRLLIDGGVIDRVPASIVRQMGADLVIAVDVSPKVLNTKVQSIFDVISQTIDIMEREIFRNQMIDADLLIEPKVGHYGITSFTDVEAIIKEGEESALPLIEKLTQMINEWEAKHAKT